MSLKLENIRAHFEAYRGTLNESEDMAVLHLLQDHNQLLETFRHTHKNNGNPGDDRCGRCGLDLRHEIHTRINQNVTAMPNEKS
jgi:hypothetical protein